MSGVNKVILVGNLGRDPETYTFESGRKRVRIAIATSEYYKNKNGERIEHTEWHNISMYGKLADIAETYLKKGNTVYIEGRIRTRQWEEDGVKKYFTEIEAQNLTMLGGKKPETPTSGKGKSVIPDVPNKLEEEPEYDPNEDSVPF